VAVVGATGSVGRSVLDICARFPDRFKVTALAARSSADSLLELAVRFGARKAFLTEPPAGAAKKFAELGIDMTAGAGGLSEIAELPDADNVVFASSGALAIKSLQLALRAGKDVSLANKESVVAAGPWVMPLVKRPDQLRPLDSEHSAIWQCIRGEPRKELESVTLTASGGPFRDLTLDEMKRVTPEDALKHPVWDMGAKITVDSASLMNKGIECIEAMHLFGLPHDRVRAVIHPGSCVHGIAAFSDGTSKMVAYRPDMRIPAAAALAWPDRLPLAQSSEFAFPGFGAGVSLDFYPPDPARFPCLGIALEAGRKGGAYPPILVGADEFAVRAFLDKRIPFLGISNIIESTLEKYSGPAPSTLEDAIELISLGGRMAGEACASMGG
jgi:1-deoxy-D-xylulose-5-phosphate reductoisomerase